MTGLTVVLGVVALAQFAVLFLGVAAVCSGVLSSSDALRAQARP